MKSKATATLYIQYDAVNKSWSWEFHIPYKSVRVSSEGARHATSADAVNYGTKIAKQIGVLVGNTHHNPAWDRKA